MAEIWASVRSGRGAADDASVVAPASPTAPIVSESQAPEELAAQFIGDEWMERTPESGGAKRSTVVPRQSP